MISSRIFTASLKYKINNVEKENFTKACEELINEVTSRLSDENFHKTLKVISVDNNVKINRKKFPNIEFIVMMYTTIEDNKDNAKLMEAYIDLFLPYISLETFDAELLKRRVC